VGEAFSNKNAPFSFSPLKRERKEGRRVEMTTGVLKWLWSKSTPLEEFVDLFSLLELQSFPVSLTALGCLDTAMLSLVLTPAPS